MNSFSSPRKINYSHAVLVAGLVLALLVIMFRPAGADATLPTKIDVFDVWNSETPSSVPLDGVGKATRDYDVILKGKTTFTKVSLTGWPIDKVLENGGANLDGVQFVKVRYAGAGSDGAISLISLDPGAERPPMILSSGKKPTGPFAAPAIVPGQPTDKPITEADIVPFNVGGKNPRISLVPGKPGGKILDVSLRAKRTSKGEIKYTPYVHNGTKNAARTIHWYSATEGDDKGIVDRGTSDTYTTDNATSGSAQRSVSVVVTEKTSGSTGGASASYNSRKKSKGRTIAPTGSTGSSGGNNNTGVTNGNTNSGVNQNGVGSSNTLPDFSTQPTSPTGQAQQSTTPPPQQPTAATSTASPDVDTTAITNAAQNVNGTGGLHTVTGVLLSSPTSAPAGGAAAATGTPLSALPAPVATQLNSIFQPVDSTDDVWAYLLAILFAFSISGAVREWVNP